MTGMIHDIEPNTSPVPASVQTQLDRLAERVAELQRDMDMCQKNFDNHDQHFRVVYKHLGAEFMANERVSAKQAEQRLSAPTSPPAATPDEAAKWEQVARASHAANRDVQGGMHWDAYTITVIHKAWIAGVQAAVAKAIALGLAAPADRVVTDAMVDAANDTLTVMGLIPLPEDDMQYVIESALAAYWRGADTQGESK